MKQIIATFTGIALVAGIALAGSAATAGTSKSYAKSTVSKNQTTAITRFGTRDRDRSWGTRHELHFGSPFLGTYGGQGSYTKSDYDRINSRKAGSRKH